MPKATLNRSHQITTCDIHVRPVAGREALQPEVSRAVGQLQDNGGAAGGVLAVHEVTDASTTG